MPTTSRIFVAVLFAISATADAQAPAAGGQPGAAQTSAAPTSVASVAQLVAAQCPRFSSQLVDRPELKPVLDQRPVDIAAVCTCTQRSFLADARLQKALNVDEPVLKERLQDERMRSYLTVRLMSSVLQCLTPELERALSASSPVK